MSDTITDQVRRTATKMRDIETRLNELATRIDSVHRLAARSIRDEASSLGYAANELERWLWDNPKPPRSKA